MNLINLGIASGGAVAAYLTHEVVRRAYPLPKERSIDVAMITAAVVTTALLSSAEYSNILTSGDASALWIGAAITMVVLTALDVENTPARDLLTINSPEDNDALARQVAMKCRVVVGMVLTMINGYYMSELNPLANMAFTLVTFTTTSSQLPLVKSNNQQRAPAA